MDLVTLVNTTGESVEGDVVRGPPFAVKKPVNLYRELIRMHTKVGDMVVEVACGSAPAARAAFLEGRQCVSFDRDQSIIPSIMGHLETLRTKIRSSQCTLRMKKRAKSTRDEEKTTDEASTKDDEEEEAEEVDKVALDLNPEEEEDV